MKSNFLRTLAVMLFLTSAIQAQTLFDWAKHFRPIGSFGENYSLCLTLDNQKNVISGGMFYNQADFDPGASDAIFSSHASFTGLDAYIVKLDSNGAYQWAKTILGNNYSARTTSVTTDKDNNIYASGYMGGTKYFYNNDSISFPTNKQRGFIAKYKPNGDFCWIKVIEAKGGFDAIYTKYNPQNNQLYMTGTYADSTYFGTTLLTSQSNTYDVYIANVDTSGSFLQVAKVGGANQDYAKGIIADTLGNLYITGSFQGTANFNTQGGTTNLVSSGGADGFALKLNASLQNQWVMKLGSNLDVEPRGIGLMPDNSHVIIAGTYKGTLVVGSSSNASAGNNDIFWSFFNAGSGNHTGTQRRGSAGDERANALYCGKSGFLLTGVFNGTLNFGTAQAGGTPAITSQGFNHYIAEYGYNSLVNWVDNFTGNGTEEGYAVLSDEQGNYFTSGYFDNTTNFAGLAGAPYTINAPGGPATFIHKKKVCAPPKVKSLHTVIPGVRDTIDFCYGNAKIYLTDNNVFVFNDSTGSSQIANALQATDSSINFNVGNLFAFSPNTSGLTTIAVPNYSKNIFVSNINCSSVRKGYHIRRPYYVKSLDVFVSDCPGNSYIKLHFTDSTQNYSVQWTNLNTSQPILGATGGVANNLPNGPMQAIISLNGCSFKIEVDVNGNNNNATLNPGHVFQNGGTLEYYWPTAPSDWSFQWYNCSNSSMVTGATNYNFTPTESGSYALILTNTTNNITCSDTSECFNMIVTSKENVDAFDVKMYPQPAHHEINIDLDGAYHYNIFSINGLEILSGNFENHEKINLNGFSNGFYLIKIQDQNQKSVYLKFIKE